MVARHDSDVPDRPRQGSAAETMRGMGTSMIAENRKMSTYALRRRAKKRGLRRKMRLIVLGGGA